ncbi:GNAT family N-acetyltransferase [Fructilactobacillus fructivorans]|uniref:Putative acetyltransferase (Putative) n=1 Tax=Fructilactobacillus fructivorans TaxID=1614 RepID=A0A0C1PP08_9LACO|nr:GNAT family N-acetyltransferase [Fructilactobacillus fructivorans]KID41646.1 putative acetyltransferase (putative) [Fructilactobacillus fructivorans]MCT0151297.1 GNAT family N-acetyltransferase [Fructilactobacillus fructivorans]MCT2867626.1 GNAT family N-acetyltransferase [Fructilactobacillus fructivorans]MCT2868856.1 GNAT family N-acetyltransferase [Fructilactobacillus fructivorans]MCT2873974.1 GNAT family N-acetyltransferase [Fructilactobacillus fructivorans]
MADDEITIRAANSKDAAPLIKLMKQLSKESKNFTTDVQVDQLTAETEAQAIDAVNATGTNLIMVAVAGTKLIGVLSISQVAPTVGELGVAILSDYQDMGLGTYLIQEAIDWIANFSQLDELTLSVLKTNQGAFRLYKKLGFVVTGQDDHVIEMKMNIKKG